MAITINVNKLSLCHKGSDGISEATLPDVCLTPAGPVPVAYPNVAYSRDLAKGTTTVDADGGNMCANYGSEFSRSTGDEPGTAGGVLSGTFMKEATWITFSFDVKLEGKGACRLTDKMFHNHMNTVNLSGERQAKLATKKWDLKCLLDILCKQDKDVVKKAQKVKIVAVDPLIFDDPIYQGGKWTTKPFHAAGTQGRGKIQMVRDMSCEAAAETIYHEMLHSEQPDTMSWPEKEYDAYKRTEQWTIDRGLPGRPAFRMPETLPPGVSGPPRQVVNEAAIKKAVDRAYPITPPSTPGGPTPPQVVGRSADGKQVILRDSAGNQSMRPVQEGDTFPADNPRNPPNEKQIPPEDFKCP
jgi:hypothetical protein